MARPTLQTIADALGVSRATVSNAYSRPDQLSPELRARILAKAEQLGYAGPDPAARRLRLGRAGALGLLFPEGLHYAFADPASIGFLNGLSEATEPSDMSLLMLPAPSPEGVGETVRGAVVDGFCLFSMAEEHPAVQAAVARRLPLVTVEGPRLEGASAVEVDNRGAARTVAEHLIALGHTRIGLIVFRLHHDGLEGAPSPERVASSRIANTTDRLAGVRDALQAVGLDWRDTPIEERFNSVARGADAAAALLARDPAPTAILAFSDLFALGARDAAREQGLDVPGDLSITGFDDIALAREAGLTTVDQPLIQKGRAAGELMLAAIAGAEPRTIALPTELIVRESTGPPPTAARPRPRRPQRRR